MRYLFLLLILTSSLGIPELKSQEITMFPGWGGMRYYQDDQQITRQEAENLFSSDTIANEFWQKSKRHETYSWIAGGAQIGFALWFAIAVENDQDLVAPSIGFVAASGISIGYTWSFATLRRKTILRYNQSLEESIGRIDLGPTQNGLGLVVSF